MRRILIVKTSSLGDVIHNLPILADIRSRLPDTVFDWVVEESFADIPRLHPAVSEVIPVAIRRWRKHLFAAATWHEIGAAKAQLQARRYDLVLDTQGLLKSGLLAWLACGPSAGQDFRSAREPMAARFYDNCYPVPRGEHAVARNRRLAALALDYPMPDTPPDYGLQVPELALPMALPSEYVVALHATSRDEKLWPESHWVELGRQLHSCGLAVLLPWGNPKEEARAHAIAAQVEGAIVLPRLGIRELTVVLAGARGVIGVDTGLVHLAVALAVPTVAIYLHSDPGLTGAYPADPRLCRNLGSAGNTPEVAAVLSALQQVTTR